MSIKTLSSSIFFGLFFAGSVKSQSLVLYLNEDGLLTLAPYPAYPSGSTGGEFEQVADSFSWRYNLQQDISDTLYTVDLLVGSVHPNGSDMEAEFILSHSGTETVLAKTGVFHAPLSGFSGLGYVYPARVYRQLTGLDPSAVSGDQLILRVKRVSGGTIGFVYLREAVKGTSSIVLGQTSSGSPINSNGGFEAATLGVKSSKDVPGWEFSSSDSAIFKIVDDPVYEGNRALAVEVTALGVNPWSIQAINTPFTVQPGTQYMCSAWAKANKAGPVVNFTVGDPSYNEWGRESQVVMTTAWQLVTFAFTSPAGATSGRAPLHFGGAANATHLPVTFYVDDFRITRRGESAAMASVITSLATSVGTGSAILTGRVNPMGSSTNAWFEYGTSPALSVYTSTQTQAMGSGTTSRLISEAVFALNQGTTYYFRLAASNAAGTNRGSIVSFTTSALFAAIATYAPSSVTSTAATLQGNVNPQGTSTSAWFEYGTSPTLSVYSSTPTQALGSGTTFQPISVVLSNLIPGTGYYFRLAANNAAGTVRGSLLSFNTPAEPTSVERIDQQAPKQYELSQNHPNPFNPSTTIQFAIPQPVHVELKVFMSSGRELKALVSETLPAGTYKTQWDATGFPSGVYFCRMRAGQFRDTRKILLVK